MVAEAIAAWAAAGVAPSALSNLGNLAVHVSDLPGAELGYFSSGAIWIDPNAAGWGWSTTGDPGRMDLRTVVEHELGHALGFDHDAAGAMEPTLAPGVQLTPEVPGAGNVAAAAPADSGPRPTAAVPGLPRAAAIDAAVTVVPDALALPAAAAVADGAAGLPAGSPDPALPVPAALFAPPESLAAAPAVPEWNSWVALVPGLWPPGPGGDDAPLAADDTAAERPAARVDPADAGFDADAAEPIAVE